MRKHRGKSSEALEVDFTGVDTKGRVPPEGDYVLRVAKAPELKEGEDSGKQYLKWEFNALDPQTKQKIGKVWHNTSLQPQALFNLKGLLIALGLSAEGKLKINPASYEGMMCGATIGHEKYNNKPSAKVTDFFPLAELTESDEDEDEDEDEVEEDEEETEDEEEEEEVPDLDAMDLDELLKYAKAEGIKIPKEIKTKAKKVRKHILDSLADEDEEEDDD